jgi:transcriptional regulator of acetoin/glycerol metabolism
MGRVLESTHPTLLLVGADAAVDAALLTWRSTYRQPVTTNWAADPLALPTLPSSGTLILRDVGALSLEKQQLLLAWLGDARGGTQVITTSRRPLWPRLESGTFLDELYYRLNVVYFDLAPQRRGETGVHPAEGDRGGQA